jgi:hypothetical protein
MARGDRRRHDDAVVLLRLFGLELQRARTAG